MTRRRAIHLLIAGALILVVATPLLVWAYVAAGVFNVAASRPHSKLVEWITHETMIRSVKRRAHDSALRSPLTAPQVVHGFCQYETHCVSCHGAAAVARQAWVNGMNPAPPYLLDMTQQWKPGELEWIVRNGIKMTGMPAWRETMSDAQIEDVTAFLEAMPKMPPQTYLRWRNAAICRQRSSTG